MRFQIVKVRASAFAARIYETPKTGLADQPRARSVQMHLRDAVVDAAGYKGLGWFIIAIVIAALALMAIATTKTDGIGRTGEAV
jgi:hypothetical protein